MNSICLGRPAAVARVRGGDRCPGLCGTVQFFQCEGHVLVLADIHGLPQCPGACGGRFFGFHIHEGTCCTGTDFADTGGHYNPHGCKHPEHAGDLPPLLECGGRAKLLVMTGRFCVEEVLGRTVVIHSHPDDFTTQPAGDSGTKIACGIIRPVE